MIYRGAAVITPHATNPINPDGHGIYALVCGVAGNIACRFEGAPADVVIPISPGFIYELKISHIRVAATTATGLVHFW